MAYVLGGIPGPLTVEFLKVYRGPFIIIISLLVGGGYTPKLTLNFWCVALGDLFLPVGDQGHLTDHVLAHQLWLFLKAAFGAEKRKNTCFTLLNTRKRVWVWFIQIFFSPLFATKSDFPTTDQQLSQDKFALTQSNSARNTAQARHSFLSPGSHHRHRRVLRFPSAFGASATVPWLLSDFPVNEFVSLRLCLGFFLRSLLILVRNNTSLGDQQSLPPIIREGFYASTVWLKIWGTQIYRDYNKPL